MCTCDLAETGDTGDTDDEHAGRTAANAIDAADHHVDDVAESRRARADSRPADGAADDGNAFDAESDHSLTDANQSWTDQYEPRSNVDDPWFDHLARIDDESRLAHDTGEYYESSELARDRCDAALSGWNAAGYDASAYALTRA